MFWEGDLIIRQCFFRPGTEAVIRGDETLLRGSVLGAPSLAHVR